ncbi:MAG TPA: SurA N-terminal domain-containing protein [Thermoleophilia bacterium]
MKRVATVTIAVLALLCVVAASVIAAGCGSSSMASGVVATVGDASITKTQVQELLAQAKTQVESQGKTFPAKGSAGYNSYTAMIVNYLVQAGVIAQNAGDLGVSVTDAEVDQQVAQIVKSAGSEKKVLAVLKQQGMTMDLLKRSIKDQMLTQRVAAKVVEKAAVSDAQIKAYWQAHAVELRKQKKTATFEKAKATIRHTLLEQAKQRLWTAWLKQRTGKLGVEYAAGYTPSKLTTSPSASASASPGG